MRILGIETSCDETAAAVVEDGHKLLSSVVASSLDMHIAYGGVVPEIAARSHIESIIPVIEQALVDAKTDWDSIDAIAVTVGPGLIGSLLIGVLTARTLAIAKNKPLYAVNHVQAHIYATFLDQTALGGYELPTNQPKFPLLALIVSGGHTQLVLFESHKKYRMLGQTTDDAVGEAYDKVAKILGLPYPGGPSADKVSQDGSPTSVILPNPHTEKPYNFSYSGLKTAVLRAAQKMVGKDYTLPSYELPNLLDDKQKADIAASFQDAAVKILVGKLKAAAGEFKPASIVVAGGVAANRELRRQIAAALPQEVIYPDIKLCTDNAAMIASLGYYLTEVDAPAADPYKLEVSPSLSM